jgi:thiosulfate/3-mercaptopyruvate sulfurtransferase
MTYPVIEVAQLAELLASGRKIAVVDCRFDPMAPEAGRQAYLAGHIPRAHYADLEDDLSSKDKSVGGRHPIPSASEFTALMNRYGVDADTLLVAYDAGDLAAASRLWWMARYFGHGAAAVLNGGLAAWLAQQQIVEPGPVPSAEGAFVAHPDPALRVDYDSVCAADHRPPMIDSRDAPRYSGAVEPIEPRAGHIPGALNMPWRESLGTNGLLRDADAQRARWQPLFAGQAAPVLYCGSGVTACVNLLCIEIAGLKGARLYPGSWSDWCQRGGAVATATP